MVSASLRSPARRRRRSLTVASLLLGMGTLVALLLVPQQTFAQRSAQIAAKPSLAPAVKAERAILMDAESGAIIFQHNAEELAAPASMSKLMTVAVIFRALRLGQIKLDEDVRVSVNAWRRGGAPSRTSAMFIPVNTTEKLDVLLQGIIVQSGNDAAIAVAEKIAGSEEKFAEMMTAEARRIGLNRATFANATGLPNPNQLMTARELAELARFLMREYPEHYARFGQKELAYRRYKFINRNPLLGVLGVDGMKTGHIKEAGYGVVASGNQDGRRLILVIAGLDKKTDVKLEGQKLLEWGYKAVGEAQLYDAGEIVGEARVWGGDRMWLPLTGKGPITIVLPRNPPNPKLKAELIYQRPLKTPISRGDEVAKLRVTTPSNSVSEVPLYAAVSVKPGGIVRRGLDTIFHHTLGWVF